MLKYRLTLGPLLIAALLAMLWAEDRFAGTGGSIPRGGVIFAVLIPITFMAARELARILREKEIAAAPGLTCGAAMVGLGVSYVVQRNIPGDEAAALVGTAAMLVLLASLGYYSRRKNTQGVIAAAGGALLAFVYLGIMFGFVLAIRRDHSAWLVAWVLLVTKMSDTGAFTFGKLFGRHKLIPWLSPGKTWEGLAGGVLFAAGFGAGGMALLHHYLQAESLPTVASAAVAGGIAALFGQAGDLVMSLFKRDAGRKDSGHSIPGFGGVLDILDSPLLVTPLAFWWLKLATS